MVEVEHDDVRLPAVNTRMRPQVLTQVAAVLFAIPLDPRDFLADIRRSIPQVVAAPVSRVRHRPCLVPFALFANANSAIGLKRPQS